MLILSSSCLAQDKVNLNADDVQYRKDENIIIAKGNAHLKSEKIELWGDKLEIDMKNNKLIATNNVKVKDEQGTVRSDKLKYNFKVSSGIFINAESIIVDNSIKGKLYMSSPEIDYGQDKSKLESTSSTSCDYDHPHYNITSSSIIIYPEDKIVAYNNFIWEFNATIPILYSPILIYSLKDDKQVLEHQIGNSEIRGWFLKNTYNYTVDQKKSNWLSSQLKGDVGQIYLDYFENTGLAFGFKHYYHYREDKHAYLYLYTEQDKLNPSYSPWVEAELNSYLRESHLTRRYNLEYSDHNSNYFRSPEKVTDLEFDFSQDNQFDDWDRDLDFTYNKNENYDHKTDFELDFDGEVSDKEELDIQLDHIFEEGNSNYSEDIERNYSLDLGYERDLNEDYYKDRFELDLDYDYDDSRDSIKEYGMDLGIRKHFTSEHYFDYEYKYDKPLDTGVIENNYLEEIDDQKTGHLNSLLLGKDQGDDFYDWELESKSFQQDSDIGYYYLPEAKATLYPGSIWDNYFLNNLDASLGGANKYASSWDRKEQNAYYQLEYYDVMSAPLNNSIIIDQNYQQDYYSTGESRWFNESRLAVNTKLFKNWNNEITHNYDIVTGEVPDRFTQKEEEHEIEERLEWRTDNSKFYIETGYDFLEEDYDLLKSELNLEFNDHYQWDAILAYDLDTSLYKEARTNLEVEYTNFKYETGLKFDLNDSELVQWDTDLDWEFGPEEWKWHLVLRSSYDNQNSELDKAEARIEKRLHCRSIALSYDHSSEEIMFQYEILAFPQSKIGIGSNDEEGMLFEDDLGGILDDIEE
ncbi:MAG: OstA-like protein [Bacillota bacterium]